MSIEEYEDGGHIWFAKEDFPKALRDLEASRKMVKKLKSQLSALNERLREADRLILRGDYFSGHFSGCEEPEDEPCTCGLNAFNYDIHLYQAKYLAGEKG